jgi:hypothetical protein
MTDRAHELDDHLATVGPAGSTGFEVTNLSSAAWAAQVIARNDRRLREAEQTMNEQVAAVSAWFEAEKRRCDTSYLRDMLIRYHRSVVDQELADGVAPDRVRKTLPLPGGVSVQRRPARPSVKVYDVDLLPPDLKTWVPVATKDRIRERLLSGEAIEGAQLELTEGADPDGYTWRVSITAPKDEEVDE